MNQAQAARSEILVRTGVLLIVNRFAARTVRITPSMVSSNYPESKYLVSHIKGIVAAPLSQI